MAKTNWTYEDIVKPEDMNQIGTELNRCIDQVSSAPPIPVTLKPGTQTITLDHDTPISNMIMQGRTLVNLLGREGNFETGLGKWSREYFSKLELSDTFAYGKQSAKITIGDTEVAGGASFDVSSSTKTDGFYIALAELKNGNGARMTLRLLSGGNLSKESTNVTNTEKFSPVFIKFQSGIGTQKLVATVHGAAGQYGYVDGVRLYEVTQAEYNAIDSMTPEEVVEKYSYVDYLQNVNAVYMENTGGNLLPPFTEWREQVGGAAFRQIISPYKLTITSPDTTARFFQYNVQAIPEQPYYLSALAEPDKVQWDYVDGSGKVIGSRNKLKGKSTIFTTPKGTAYIYMFVFNDAVPGTFVFENPMLVLGSEPKPFRPQRKSYMYLPTCQLASNLDGSVADRMYMDNEGKPRVIRQFRRVELTGGMKWWINKASGNLIDYKEVALGIPSPKQENVGVIVKYDGKILNKKPDNVLPEGPDVCTISTIYNNVYITIANSDSGWGPDYTPTQEEIKAYFYGWKMYDENIKDDGTSSYNNDPGAVKRWTPIDSFDGSRYYGVYNGPGVPTEAPTSANTLYVYRKNRDWTPYLLQYQLATPVDEPLEHEGSLMLCEGANQVEVGAGVVVREKANPQWFNAGNAYIYVINSTFDARMEASKLQYRANKLRSIYRNNKQDKYWIFESPGKTYGNEQAKIYDYNYDPSAVYQVTYLALDTYKIGITPTEISAEYAANLRGTVDSLVEGNKNALGRITVLENETAMKEVGPPQWITPTLLNGWVGYEGGFTRPQYHKDFLGYVHLRGRVKNGTVGQKVTLFWLPSGYRPANTILTYTYQDYTGRYKGEIVVSPSGEVSIYTDQNSDGKLDGISYLAEQ